MELHAVKLKKEKFVILGVHRAVFFALGWIVLDGPSGVHQWLGQCAVEHKYAGLMLAIVAVFLREVKKIKNHSAGDCGRSANSRDPVHLRVAYQQSCSPLSC